MDSRFTIVEPGRGVGTGAKRAEAKYKERGSVLAEDQIVQMLKQLETFKSHLEEFASKHKQEIRKNPQFRVQFQEMCATISDLRTMSEPTGWKTSMLHEASSRHH
uniref:BAR domain-containing protein n=1 Tax=Amphiprion ocellaris TaxID=80972 RepID=A0AAQ5YD24_AMPOC